MERLKDAICDLVSNSEDATTREHFEELDNMGAEIIVCLDELQAYRDAEEKGLLLRLPCKEGDEVFEPRDSISGQTMRSGTVQRFEIKNGNIKVMTTIGMFNAWDFGKTVFLSENQKGE